MKIMNTGSLIFEEIGLDIYAMTANRYGKVDNKVYSKSDFIDLEKMGYKIEVRNEE